MDFFKDTWNAVAALSRLGRSQLLLVLIGSVVSTILAGICTSWGGSAFFATIAFLICDVVNAMYSITYENSFAFTSLAVLLVEQNVVLTAGTAVGIMDDGEDWVPKSLKWVAVGFGWLVLAVLLMTQLALRKDWGWHAHKLGLARADDVALYQRILQLEGAILLDFCQVIPCCVVLIGKYGFASNPNEHVTQGDGDVKLQHVVNILFFVAAALSVVCAPVLGGSARRENPTPFGVAGFVTMCTSGMIVFGTVDAMRRVGWPPQASDAILFALVIMTCIGRTILIGAILRIPTAVFGSGIASRINRGGAAGAGSGILLPSNIEGWSECRRSAFGGGRSTAADTEGAAMLYGNIDDYSDTESDIGQGNSSNPNLVYGERVKIRESIISRHSGNGERGARRGHNHQYNYGSGDITSDNSPPQAGSQYPSLLSQQSGSTSSPTHHHHHHQHNHHRNNYNNSYYADPNSTNNLSNTNIQHAESTNSMRSFNTSNNNSGKQHKNSHMATATTNNQNTTPLLARAQKHQQHHESGALSSDDDDDNHDGRSSTNNNNADDDNESLMNRSRNNNNNQTRNQQHLSLGQLSQHHAAVGRIQNSSMLDDGSNASEQQFNNNNNRQQQQQGRSKSPNTIFVKASVGRRPSDNNVSGKK